jgi:hypothetical protein
MDYVTAGSVEWMEMDARTIHFHGVDAWTVDMEWIASLSVVHDECSDDSGDDGLSKLW